MVLKLVVLKLEGRRPILHIVRRLVRSILRPVKRESYCLLVTFSLARQSTAMHFLALARIQHLATAVIVVQGEYNILLWLV
jgi:hypothetical protein